MQLSEEAEKELSYLTSCGSEQARKQSGSYYTPTDVSAYFWNEFFSLSAINTRQEVTNFVKTHAFVEPSVGAGSIVFSLLLRLTKTGVDRLTIANIDLTLIDINQQALSFVKRQFDILSERWGIEFPNIKLVCSDFQNVCFKQSNRPYFFFGNPPFVTNNKGESKWNNSFADFVETSLENIQGVGALQFILPLSVSFSRDYSDLRKCMLEHHRCISLSHFDNIPDTLFKSGKPQNTNSNKANSQRCSILTIFPANKMEIRSTSLIRWSKYDREKVLSESPLYYDISSYRFNDQFPRPENIRILNYINQSQGNKNFSELLSSNGIYQLYVSTVARNYIGFREDQAPNVHQFGFNTKQEFYRALLILSSDLFFDYWKTVGDGFHITKGNILNFPLNVSLDKIISSKLTTTQRIWTHRNEHRKTKLNSGKITSSYDFSKRMPSLLNEVQAFWQQQQERNICLTTPVRKGGFANVVSSAQPILSTDNAAEFFFDSCMRKSRG